MSAAVERRKALSLFLATTGGLLVLADSQGREPANVLARDVGDGDNEALIRMEIEQTVDFAASRQQKRLTPEERERLVNSIYRKFKAILEGQE